MKPVQVVLLTILLTFVAVADAASQPNVLFIAVDDLRPEISCYGMDNMVTPNFDRLAAQGVRFSHAYCNIAVCGASRASLMKGLRPTPTRFTSYLTRADQDAPDVPSLAFTFKQAGYTTVSNGKVYHHNNDDMEAWSQKPWRPDRNSLWWAKPENRPAKDDPLRGPAFEAADVPDAEYPDAMLCEKTLTDLRRLAKQDAPFFLACGFWRPHLPFVAPQKYWDLYPEQDVKLAENDFFPHGLADAFSYQWGEMRSYRGIPKQGPVSEETARNLIRGYHACVSFIDVQLGRLLDELQSLGIAENTIVVLWGDHGWQLGEHGFWCKHTNFEVATRTPLFIAAPGCSSGETCERLVEYVDIYPTLCDLAKIPIPAHVAGQSMTPLLKDVTADFKDAVFTRYGAGDAIRTEKFRYMEMRTNRGAGNVHAVGLFDLSQDPQENQDVSQASSYAEDLKRLQSQLRQTLREIQ